MDRNICFIIFAIFVAYTARDLFFNSLSNQHDNRKHHASSSSEHYQDLDSSYDSIQKEIPSITLRKQQIPTVKVLYCYSCGYQRAFDEYRKIIMEQFPDLNVIGSNYNPGFFKNKFAQLISIAKMVLIALLVANINPFLYFGMQTPQIWEWMREHKLYACMMTFFLSNTIESQLMSSGAFEVFYNDVPIWSKLTTGRMPAMNEMIDIIKNQHNFRYDANGRDHLTSIPSRSL